jgi:hypothetical protein
LGNSKRIERLSMVNPVMVIVVPRARMRSMCQSSALMGRYLNGVVIETGARRVLHRAPAS